MQADKSKKLVAFLAVMIVIVAIVGTIVLSKNKDETTNSAATTTETTGSDTVDTPTGSATSNAAYKDGTYTAEGSYNTPGGQESITITITLQNGVVTNTSASSTPSDLDAEEYQNEFKSGYSGQVVGKKVDSIRLNRVAGSSLTSDGFNNALDQIKNQAKV